VRLYSFCAIGLMGVELLCFNKSASTVIDSSCGMREVRLPAKWKAECIDPDSGKLRQGLDHVTRAACVNTAGNNRELKRKVCVKPTK
jgi:hypothetical protein